MKDIFKRFIEDVKVIIGLFTRLINKPKKHTCKHNWKIDDTKGTLICVDCGYRTSKNE